jgi:acyl-CoA thioesterase-1
MRSFILKLLILSLLASTGLASNQGPTVLIMGDSLSAGFGIDTEQGWTVLLQRRLESKGYGYTVANASISGDTTTGGLRRLPRALERLKPDIVIIELGGNDGLRGTPVELIHTNLSKMIEQSIDSGARVILTGIQIPPNYGPAYTDAFRNIYPSLAEQFDIGLIEFFLKNVALNPSLMQADGIHPNAAGQPILLENVWSVLQCELEATLSNQMGNQMSDRAAGDAAC